MQHADGDATLDGILRDRARQQPDAVALVQGDQGRQVVSYAELDVRVRRYAAGLARAGVGPGQLVPVVLDRSIDLVAAMAAVMTRGAAYAVLDPDWPAARLAETLELLDPPLLVTADGAVPVGSAGVPDGLPRWTPESSPTDTAGAVDAVAPHGPEDACAVFFTSGTTGPAKCVPVPHRAVARLFTAGPFAEYGPGTVIPQLASAQWDMSAWEIWAALCTGGSCVLVEDPYLTPARLRRLVRPGGTHGITAINTAFLTTSLFNLLVDEDVDAFTGMRTVTVGGERLSPPHVRRFLAAHPGIPLRNGYGPVESTALATSHLARPADCARPDGIPVGTPLPGTGVLVLAGERECPPGQPGEICLSGTGLAHGYLGQPAETEVRFPTLDRPEGTLRVYRTGDLGYLDADGLLHYLGRVDRQLKLRGHRVEPAGIEAVLGQVPGVARIVVLPRRDPTGAAVGLLAFHSGDPAAAERLAATAEAVLPAYQRPGEYHWVAAFPLTGNGKLDEAALLDGVVSPGPSMPSMPSPAAPASDTATGTVSRILAELLGSAPATEDTPMASLGATSLTVIRLCGRLETELGIPVPPAVAFARPTAALLGAWLDSELAGQRDEPPDPLPPAPASGVPLNAVQTAFLAAQLLDPADRTGHCPMLWRLRGRLDPAALDLALRDVRRRHQALHARYLLGRAPADPAVAVVDRPAGGGGLRQLPVTADPLAAVVREIAGPFELAAGVNHRAALAQDGPREWILGLSISHVAFDGWSESVLCRDLSTAYRARSAGATPVFPTPAPGLAELWSEQRRRAHRSDLASQRAYWKGELAGVPELEFPVGPAAGPGLVHAGFTISAAELERLSGLAARQAGTVFAALLAGYGAALAEVTGGTDFGIGVPLARRTPASIDAAVCCQVDVVCLRLWPLSGGDGAVADPGAEVAKVTATVAEAFAAQDVAVDEVVRLLNPRRGRRPPLYQAMFTLQDSPVTRLELAGTESVRLQPRRLGVPTELLAEVWPGQDGQPTRVELTGRADRVGQQVVDAVAGAYRRWVRGG